MYSHGNIFSQTDRYDARGADDQTLQHLSRKLEYPVEDILRAIQEVGCDLEDVAEYIRDRYNRT